MMRGSIVLQSTQVLALDVRQGGPYTDFELGTLNGKLSALWGSRNRVGSARHLIGRVLPRAASIPSRAATMTTSRLGSGALIAHSLKPINGRRYWSGSRLT